MNIEQTTYGFYGNCLENKPGAYFLINFANNKVYLGSSKNTRKRRNQHFSDLQNKNHSNQHLQRAYDKNPNSWGFSVIEYTNGYKNLEQQMLDLFFGKYCYNNSKTVFFPTMSEEGLQRLIASKKKMHIDKPGIADKMIEYSKTPEVRAALGKATKKRHENPQYMKNITDKAREKLKKYFDIDLINPNGEIIKIGWNLREFCRNNSLDKGCMNQLLNGKAKSHKGWRLKK